MEAPAAWTDVQAIWRPLQPAEVDIVNARIEQAWDQIRDETPPVGGLTVEERLDAGTLRVTTVQRVIVAMVHRVVSVPGYLRQRSITVDDATKSETFDSTVSSGEMTITVREMDRLLGRKAGRPRAFTIVPSAGRSWI